MLPFLLLVLLVFLVLLIFLRLDTIPLLHLAETEWVGHEGLIGSLLLLFDGEKRVLSDLRRRVADSIGILSGDEVLMGSTDL